jgi:hypothetical protein
LGPVERFLSRLINGRKLQATDVAEIIKSKKENNRPALWLGYLTGKPESANYNTIMAAGMKDMTPDEWDRYCLYHFHMGLEASNFQVFLEALRC